MLPNGWGRSRKWDLSSNVYCPIYFPLTISLFLALQLFFLLNNYFFKIPFIHLIWVFWNWKQQGGSSFLVQWLGLYTSTSGHMGWVLGWEAKISQTVWCSQIKNTHTHTHLKNKKKTQKQQGYRKSCTQKKRRGNYGTH